MGFLALCPRIKKIQGYLKATTPWTIRLLSLGSYFKRVVVDPSAKTVVITSRYFWIFRRVKIIRFSDIHAVTYGYGDMSPDQYLSFGHDSVDKFNVGLRLAKRDEIHLFTFLGEGTFENNGPFPDWCYWPDKLFDFKGSQQKESRVFVDLVSQMINVKVVPPSP